MRKNERQPEPRLNLRGTQLYLNAFEAPKVQNRKLLAVVTLLAAVAALQSCGLARMIPLKERVPYVIKVEADATGAPTGKVTVTDAGVQQFQPTEAHLRYFLGRWSEDLLSVDNTSREIRLPQSYALLKGQALDDWKRYINEVAKPLDVLALDANYHQRAELISITFLSKETAMIRVKLTNNKGAPERRVQVNVTYALIPPTSDDDVYRNPIGLWITSFGVTNELA